MSNKTRNSNTDKSASNDKNVSGARLRELKPEHQTWIPTIFRLHGSRKAAPIHPAADKSDQYTIAKRRKKGRKKVWVPADAHMEDGASVVSYPALSWWRYHAPVQLLKILTLAALAALLYTSNRFVFTLPFFSQWMQPFAPASYVLANTISLAVMWVVFATTSRALNQYLPCCFLTERAFFYKDAGLYADTHSVALLVCVDPTERTFRSDRICFRAHGCNKQETAYIRSPSKFAQVLQGKFVQPNENIFPELVKPQKFDTRRLRAA